jgi:hypothetical protein
VVVEVHNNAELERECNSGVCYIGLLDGAKRDRDQWFDAISVLEKLNDKYSSSSVKFLYLDGGCQGALLGTLEIPEDALPNFIVYVP